MNSFTKTYDGTDSALGATCSPTSGSLAAGETLTPFFAFDDKNWGIGSKTVNITNALIQNASLDETTDNYILTFVENTTSTINKQQLTGELEVDNKIYDGNTSAVKSVVSLYPVYVDDFVVIDWGSTIAEFNDEDVQDATYAALTSIVLTGDDKDNYVVGVDDIDPDEDAKITPRPITVTADTQTKVYGDADPALTYQITSGNIVGGDSFSGALSRAAGENVDDYTITQNTLALDSNYTITYISA